MGLTPTPEVRYTLNVPYEFEGLERVEIGTIFICWTKSRLDAFRWAREKYIWCFVYEEVSGEFGWERARLMLIVDKRRQRN